jgi:hypothetical protein
MLVKRSYLAAVIVLGGLISGVNVSVAGGLIGGFAAETGTKTMPDSSVAPPRAYRSYFNYVHRRRHECALPSSRCGNNHRITN